MNGEKITDPDEIRKALTAIAQDYIANRTSEEAMVDEMADHYGDMFEATVKRLEPEFAADGWSRTALTYNAKGLVSVEFWRTDLLEAARIGRAEA